MLGKPIVALFATILFKEICRSQWLTRMAIAASPSTYTMGVFGPGSASPSTRGLVLSLIAVGVELALFILIPIYVRSRRRAKIRSRLRILYHSRFEPALAMRLAQTRSASPLLRPTKSSRRAVREIGPSGIGCSDGWTSASGFGGGNTSALTSPVSGTVPFPICASNPARR